MGKAKTKTKNQAEVPVKLTGLQKDQIAEYLVKNDKRPEPINFEGKKGADNTVSMTDLKGENGESSLERLMALNKTTGMVNPGASATLLNQVALIKSPKTMHEVKTILKDTSTLMLELQPRDAFEGLLVTQMVTCQDQVMSCLRQAESSKFIDHRELHLRFADRFMKTFTKQLETLAKYRRGGQQKVVVEHVNVNEGGQAIIGSVNNQGGGQDAEKK